jgi:hypothetical protein
MQNKDIGKTTIRRLLKKDNPYRVDKDIIDITHKLVNDVVEQVKEICISDIEKVNNLRRTQNLWEFSVIRGLKYNNLLIKVFKSSNGSNFGELGQDNRETSLSENKEVV